MSIGSGPAPLVRTWLTRLSRHSPQARQARRMQRPAARAALAAAATAATVAALAGLAGLACTAAAVAQTTTGTIEGRIVGPDGGALPGVTVTATGARPGTRVTTTDGFGIYHLAALPPGTYEVTAELPGYATQRSTANVSVVATVRADFRLNPSLAEVVTVTGAAPQIDPDSVEMSGTVDARAFEKLPLARDYVQVALLEPGVTTDNNSSLGLNRLGLSVFGATSLENQYLIDGVDVTGMRIGSEVKTIPEQFLQQIEIKTAAYPAEFGRALGGVINAITPSGGNAFHGEGYGYFNNQDLQAQAKPGVVGGNFAASGDQDYGAGLGGFLVKDRLWFFGVYDRTQSTRDTTLVTGSGSPFDGSTFRSADQSQNLYSGKLTWTPTNQVDVVGSVIGDPTTNTAQLVEDGPPATRMINIASGRPDVSVIASGVTDRFLAEIGFFDHRELNNVDPVVQTPFLTSDPTQVPTLNLATCNLPGCYSGAPWVFIPLPGATPLLDESYSRKEAKGSITGYLGPNQVKVGADYSALSGTVTQSIPGGYNRVLSALANGQELFTQTWFGDPSGAFGEDHVVPSVSGNPKTDNFAMFAQDTWTALPNLTVNAGVRYDQFTLKDAVTGATVTNLTGNFVPRVGVAWDPESNGKSKVTFAYGRFVEALPLDIQAGAFRGTSVSITDLAGFTFDCGPTSISCTSFPNTTTEPADPKLKAPLSEQYNLGYRRSLSKDVTVGINGIYSNLLRAVEDRCDLQGNMAALDFASNGCVLMNPGVSPWGMGNFASAKLPPGVSGPILCTNGLNPSEGRASGACLPEPRAQRTYKGVTVSAEDRFSPSTYVLASYTYSQLRGNYDGDFNELGQATPHGNLDFDYVGLSQNSFGDLANDRPNQAKVTGFYTFGFGLTAGVNAYFRSGIPIDKLGSFALVNGEPIPLFLDPRGSNGRTPSDWDMDLHADYPLVTGPVRFDLILDLFRVFNHQTVLRVNPFFNEDGFQSDNGIQTNPTFGEPILRADPRLLRFGMTVKF
jgi:outer membrane receptor protein involved in Fe transport